MNCYFLFIQLLGVIAWAFLGVSYFRKNTNKILVFQIIGNILFCIHYLLLGAYSGLFICAFEIVFDYGYYKTEKDKLIYLISIPIRVLGGIITYKSLIDILPITASLIDGYALTFKRKIVIYGAIVSYIIWVIYDVSVLSYSGAIFDGIIIFSNIFIILTQYYKKKKIDE